ncbi:hypothetical protein GCM10010103_25800 [Streptomyces paradoxus]
MTPASGPFLPTFVHPQCWHRLPGQPGPDLLARTSATVYTGTTPPSPRATRRNRDWSAVMYAAGGPSARRDAHDTGPPDRTDLG